MFLIDATYLKAHRTISSLGLKGGTSDRSNKKWNEHQVVCRY
jgi:hypothetical protein